MKKVQTSKQIVTSLLLLVVLAVGCEEIGNILKETQQKEEPSPPAEEEVVGPVKATGVTLEAIDQDVYLGDELYVQATVLPEDAEDFSVSWTSSDDTIATIDENGLLTTQNNAGVVSITAMTTDGGFTATMDITVNPPRPPFEVYFFDQEEMPVANSVPGTTYTAKVYILDNTTKKRYGPYNGSTFPNAKEDPEGSDRPNTADNGAHYFNNKYGHKGSTRKGLNLIDVVEQRKTDGYSWTNVPTIMTYVNVHYGISDRGNYNSRGSRGCLTIHPDEVDEFMSFFDFTGNSAQTTGDSNGTVYISRTNETERTALINEIESIYE